MEVTDSSSISKLIADYIPDMSRYEALYRTLHTNPELSLQEKETANAVATCLKTLLGFEVRTHIGGYGVVGILKNGPGRTVLLRAELDALPVLERTGLEFASSKSVLDLSDNIVKPVMHACGHDLHIASLLAASELLSKSRGFWSGTIVVLFQPNEERGAGAQAMVDDGLFDATRHHIPIPDVALGGHVMPMKAGTIKTRKGVMGSAADSLLVTLYGRGGHGSRPHTAVDPVVLASSTVMKLQTIVSRETDPRETVVVTVGSLHAGSAANIISDEAELQINIRTFSSQARQKVREAVERIIDAECRAFGSPKPPLIRHIGSFPLLYNDEAATEVVSREMKNHFGGNFDTDATISTGSEDFANLTSPLSIPSVFWNYGGINAQQWDNAVQNGRVEDIPGNHSSFFAPVIQPTLMTGTEAYATAALAYLI
ncbi:hippurate hydrolase [Cladophialophora psammophila CBS 110553]|uniref:Hippurate hydrolase n=1 Tax=Cladophialophora psammophila CBS 110553 TaxID=1182543 RepID=W9X4Y9_9EURO|nr:hippurate hydrolase [Cladophialophora psammophila CBS 110553]EXJ72355.1 hippurate hydrolase [Cladophialophora psammophila CBS 110553]